MTCDDDLTFSQALKKLKKTENKGELTWTTFGNGAMKNPADCLVNVDADSEDQVAGQADEEMAW